MHSHNFMLTNLSDESARRQTINNIESDASNRTDISTLFLDNLVGCRVNNFRSRKQKKHPPYESWKASWRNWKSETSHRPVLLRPRTARISFRLRVSAAGEDRTNAASIRQRHRTIRAKLIKTLSQCEPRERFINIYSICYNSER